MGPLLDLLLDLFSGGVLVFLVAYIPGSQIHLREVYVFDEAVLPTGGTCKPYGQGPPVPMPVKLTEGCPRIVLSPRRIIKCKNNFYHVKMLGNDSFHRYFIIELLIRDPV
jgi:hypothetical protein